MIETQQLVEDFMQIARLSGVELAEAALSVEVLPAPHRPPRCLPAGTMAVYVFHWGDRCLKVGKVGSRSQARYTSQHYLPRSSNSNLSKSISQADADRGLPVVSEAEVGDWLKQNTTRHNFLLDASVGVPVLTLLESFLQCRLRPEFEGFSSQRT